jgi:hypothetical protein
MEVIFKHKLEIVNITRLSLGDPIVFHINTKACWIGKFFLIDIYDIQTQTRNSEYSPVSSKKNQRRKSPSDSPKTKSIKSRKPETASNGHVTNTSSPNRGQRSSSNINVNQEDEELHLQELLFRIFFGFDELLTFEL